MHKLLGGLCRPCFSGGLPQIGHAADPVPLKRHGSENMKPSRLVCQTKRLGSGGRIPSGNALVRFRKNSLWRAEHGALGNRRLRGHSRADRIAGQPGRGSSPSAMTNPWPPASMHARTAPSRAYRLQRPLSRNGGHGRHGTREKPSCAPQAPPRTIPCTSGWKPSA